MLDLLYEFLRNLGYPHPLHAPLTHMPIGLVTGALILGFFALVWRLPILGLSARHCLILAWLFWFPTVILGLMDWQHFYAIAWIYEIKMKLILAGVLGVLLTIGLFVGRHQEREVKGPLIIYALSFFLVVGLGWYGGNLVFGEKTPETFSKFKVGKQIFEQRCSGCHPRGGNVIMPDMPLLGSSKLSRFNTFIGFIREPKMPDGSKGPMPAFGEKEISHQQAEQLYHYLVKDLAKAPNNRQANY